MPSNAAFSAAVITSASERSRQSAVECTVAFRRVVFGPRPALCPADAQPPQTPPRATPLSFSLRH
eukprot:2083837-Pleurochrysis_carterae.AAC.2